MFSQKITALLYLLSTATVLQAQDSLLLRDYQFVKRSDPWLVSLNAAALTRYATINMAQAEVSVRRSKGDFTDFFDSPNVLQANASVESFYRLSPKAVVYGAMSYDHFSGKDMAGSAFMPLPADADMFSQKQSHLPFDLVEDSLSNTGTKHRDIYRLTGGVGCSVLGDASLGLRLSYTSANYAKYKDLRHKNKLMDLQLSAGIYVPVSCWLSLGAHYLYHRNTESVLFSTYGKNDKVYKTLVDYAAFTGPVEQFGSTGFTDKSREMPLVNDYHGVGAQFCIQLAGFRFYNAFSYAHRSGYYGRKSPYTITYTGHKSHVYDYSARLSYEAPQVNCHLDVAIQAENLKNEANTYRELQNTSGATYYEYYAPVKTANKLWTDGHIALTVDLLRRDSQSFTAPRWTFQTGTDWQHQKHTAYQYPFYRRQKLSSQSWFASATHHLLTSSGLWSFTGSYAFTQGSDTPFEDFTFQTPSDKQTMPATMEAYLYRQYEYLTAPQYTVSGQVKYTFMLPATHLQSHVALTLSHHKANGSLMTDMTRRSGRDHTAAALSLGCTF